MDTKLCYFRALSSYWLFLYMVILQVLIIFGLWYLIKREIRNFHLNNKDDDFRKCDHRLLSHNTRLVSDRCSKYWWWNKLYTFLTKSCFALLYLYFLHVYITSTFSTAYSCRGITRCPLYNIALQSRFPSILIIMIFRNKVISLLAKVLFLSYFCMVCGSH